MEKQASKCWFCPSTIGIVAGVIMFVAGLGKFIAGKATLTAVGGMVLGLFGVAQGEMASFALTLGAIAATIEVLGGLSFALGCCKTSKYAAVGLSIVMFFALLAKLKGIPFAEANGVWQLIAGTISQLQVDLLLLAIFVPKAIRTIKSCCGMKCTDCCESQCEVK